ncbi:MAG: hypothetical protein R3175_14830 [Marinobacter sp.]|uniref:hypothetical protein n=1 Tax=Marinobacter sp. TaxID=50741 RepID=UPI00299CFD57|nr:hypothetical protein [Marinobacter sp.]MDX1757329.1 hypothetical protein [Marinobacter sp.]
MITRTLVNALALLLPLGALSGCASYYSHYAMFPASNSSGESRMVRLTWQSADYPDWWLAQDQATSIQLETQCSERVWRLTDQGQASPGGCGEGIRACGRPGLDLLEPNRKPVGEDSVCLAVYPERPGIRITDLGATLELNVYCRPSQITRGRGDEAVNLDYIRSSAVPYVVNVKKAPRGSLAGRLPAFDESVCD